MLLDKYRGEREKQRSSSSELFPLCSPVGLRGHNKGAVRGVAAGAAAEALVAVLQVFIFTSDSAESH